METYTCYFKPKIYCNISQKVAKQFSLHSAEAYSEPFQTSRDGSRATATSKIERFVIILNGFHPLPIITKRSPERLSKEVTSLEVTIFTKSPILDVWQGSGYAIAQWTIKAIKLQKAKTHNMAILRQGTYVYLITGKTLKQPLNWSKQLNCEFSFSIPSNNFFDY